VLDFFRDIYAEMNGLDPQKMREEKLSRKKNLTMSRAVKTTIRIVGILYLLIASVNIISMVTNGFNLAIFKYIIAVIIDVVVLIFTFFESKQSKIIVAAGVVVFIGINFMTQRM